MADQNPICSTNKALANALGRNERYVTDLRRGGLQMPIRLNQAMSFIRRYGSARQFRSTCPGRR